MYQLRLADFFSVFASGFVSAHSKCLLLDSWLFFLGGGSHILWIKTPKMKITKTTVPVVLFMAVQFGSPPVARFGDIDYTVTS